MASLAETNPYDRIRRAPYIRWGSFLTGGSVIGLAHVGFDNIGPLQLALAWAGAILFVAGQLYVMFTKCPACGKLRFIHFSRSSARGSCAQCGDRLPLRGFAA